MRILKHIIPVLILFCDGCIDPLNIAVEQHESLLVVDGLITDGPGPHQVRLFHSSALDDVLRRPEAETGAAIWIADDQGNEVLLNEIEPGVYETGVNSLVGQVGKSYRLKISTADGKEYASGLQHMSPAGNIRDIAAEFKSGVLNGDDPSRPQDAIAITLDGNGVEGQLNLFRWRWKGTYQAQSFPQLRTRAQGLERVPDPEPCSGYVSRSGELVKVAACTCCICWSTEFGPNALVSDNNFVKASSFSKVNITLVPVTAMRFLDRYYIEVEQMSVSEEVHNFWRLVKAQQDAVGNLFQPNAIKIAGNIRSLSDPGENVLGVFAVSAVTRKSVFINRDLIPGVLPAIDTLGYDCRKVFPNSTISKPIFW